MAKQLNPVMVREGAEVVADGEADGFARARVYAAGVRQGAKDAVCNALLCGAELVHLQTEYGHAHGGDRKGSRIKVPRGTLITFEEIAEQKLGIPRRTAFRWMSMARRVLPSFGWAEGQAVDERLEQAVMGCERVCEISKGQEREPRLIAEACGGSIWLGNDEQRLDMIERIAAGETVAWQSRGDTFERGGSEVEIEAAKAFLEKIDGGEITPSRAWAGLAGVSATKRQPRPARRVVKEIGAALGSLLKALTGWDELDVTEQVLVRQKVNDTLLVIEDQAEADLGARAIRALAELKSAYQHINRLPDEFRYELMMNVAALRQLLPSQEAFEKFVEERRAARKTMQV